MKKGVKENILEATKFIQNRCEFRPQYGIILGTGLGSLVDEVKVKHTIDYVDIPHFPTSTIEFHKGKLILGLLEGKQVVIMQGRFHYYEGYSMEEITFPVRVLKMLGIERLFISNAAGGLNPKYHTSDLMVINDHINLLPENPLRGDNLDDLGPRFPDMSEPYDLVMVNQALKIAKSNNISAHEGVYVGVQGPNLETRAEYRFLNIIGADAVGMSTIPENIVARHMGLPCFAVSVITDLCSPGNIEEINIEKIISAATKGEKGMTLIIKGLIASL